MQSRQKAVLHPGIDGLVAMIQSSAKASTEEMGALRELCRNKIRSYSEDAYLKRYTSPEDQRSARERWRLVAECANRR